jgi:polysaccharide biosynthesis/export protein
VASAQTVIRGAERSRRGKPPLRDRLDAALRKRGDLEMRADDGQKRQESGALRHFVAFVVLGLEIALSGCGTSAQPLTEARKEAMVRLASAPPKLEAGETIRVAVYGEPSLSGTYQIDPSGLVSLPLAGSLKAVGLTEREFAKTLAVQFSRGYLKNPRVIVSIARFSPFYILGEVQKPGAYSYSAGMNVFNAIAIAGGLTYRASRSTIMIEHRGETAMRAYDLSWPIPILPADIIKLPRRYF